MSDTVKKIKAIAKKAADERFANERAKLEENSKQDLAQLDRIIKMVEDKLVYKTVGDSWNKKYVVVTEDIVFEDYTTSPKGYSQGKTGIFKNEATYYQIAGVVIYVNGHVYYHAQDIFRRYENEVEQAIAITDAERDLVQKKKDGLKALKNLNQL